MASFEGLFNSHAGNIFPYATTNKISKLIPEDHERILLATGQFLGEGFDDARLDTLFLAHPISWEGKLHQYAGRLHREIQSKESIEIFDYVDKNVSVLLRMYEKRLKGYRAIGYKLQEVSGASFF